MVNEPQPSKAIAEPATGIMVSVKSLAVATTLRSYLLSPSAGARLRRAGI
jgi:hypothetical protein